VNYVDAAGAFYEDFTDDWVLPIHNDYCQYCKEHPHEFGERLKYPQRVDVMEWRYYVPAGVPLTGTSTSSTHSVRAAAFPISKDFFQRIRSVLEQQGGQP
jgi:hypothetical protein